MTVPRPAAFDAFAASYDQTFTESILGQLLRQRVWRVLQDAFMAGSHVLELTCGTGADAVWLARRGVRVTATDGSPAMLEAVREKVSAAGLDSLVSPQRLSLQEISEAPWPAQPPFDGAFSNFGGLNTIADCRPLARSLARAVQPGGKVILVPMGPYCPWEILWHLGHGAPSTALRRLRQPATARVGMQTIPIWYPNRRQLQRAFAPWFHPLATYSLGLWLPPSYLDHLVQRYARLFRRLDRLEAATARLTGGWGDHYIAVFERRLSIVR